MFSTSSIKFPSMVFCTRAGNRAGSGNCARSTRRVIRGCTLGERDRCRFRRIGLVDGPCIFEGMPRGSLDCVGAGAPLPRRRRAASRMKFAADPLTLSSRRRSSLRRFGDFDRKSLTALSVLLDPRVSEVDSSEYAESAWSRSSRKTEPAWSRSASPFSCATRRAVSAACGKRSVTSPCGSGSRGVDGT